jgi:hypothetical protein
MTILMYAVLILILIAGVIWYFTRNKSTYYEPTAPQAPTEPEKCSKGFVWDPVAQICKEPTGLCPPGYYSGTGKAPCLECPEDMYCPGHGKPIPCEIGKKAVKGSISCA